MATQNGVPDEYSFIGWQQLLDQYPAQYYSSPAGMAFGRQSPRRSRYFSNAYEDILKDYWGAAGTAMRADQAPATFMEFLEGNPWTARYASFPQTARGVTGLATNPRTRFLYNF